MPKFFVGDTVKFTLDGKEYTGVIQGIKQGTGKANGEREPLYWIWTEDKGQWVRENQISIKMNL